LFFTAGILCEIAHLKRWCRVALVHVRFVIDAGLCSICCRERESQPKAARGIAKRKDNENRFDFEAAVGESELSEASSPEINFLSRCPSAIAIGSYRA